MRASIEVENETNDDRSGSKIVNSEGFKRFQLFLRLECGYLATLPKQSHERIHEKGLINVTDLAAHSLISGHRVTVAI